MGLLCISTLAAIPVQTTAQCAASPRLDMLAGIIAPAAGSSPVWFVDGGFGSWRGDSPIKSVWILARSGSGDLHVSGRKLQGDESPGFRTGMTGPITSTLTIRSPLTQSMVPGGASTEVMQEYAFVSTYVFYPSAGCWEFEAEFGGQRRTIVVNVN